MRSRRGSSATPSWPRSLRAGPRGQRRSTRSPGIEAPRFARSATELADDGQRLVDGVGSVSGWAGVRDAALQVMLEQLQWERIERRLHGADLRQDVDAIALVFDHAADTAKLPFDAVQALRQCDAVCAIARDR